MEKSVHLLPMPDPCGEIYGCAVSDRKTSADNNYYLFDKYNIICYAPIYSWQKAQGGIDPRFVITHHWAV
jgi:hypothetical protein